MLRVLVIVLVALTCAYPPVSAQQSGAPTSKDGWNAFPLAPSADTTQTRDVPIAGPSSSSSSATKPRVLTDAEVHAMIEAEKHSARFDLLYIAVLGSLGVSAFAALIYQSRTLSGLGLGFTRLWIVMVAIAALIPAGHTAWEIGWWWTENIFDRFDVSYLSLWQRGAPYYISTAVVPIVGLLLWVVAVWIARGFRQARRD